MDRHELRILAEKATPGPWEFRKLDDGVDPGWTDHGPWIEPDILFAWGHDAWGVTINDEDGEFIAAANPKTVLALLDETDALSSQVQSLTLEVEGLRGREEKLVKVIVENAVPLEVLNMVAVEDQGRRYLSHKLMQSVKDACERSRIVAVEWNSRNALQGSVGETVCEECDEGWVAKDYEEAGIYIERCPKCQGDSQ